jgi:hypothetical protein
MNSDAMKASAGYTDKMFPSWRAIGLPNLVRLPLARALQTAVKRHAQAKFLNWKNLCALAKRAETEVDGRVVTCVLLVV